MPYDGGKALRRAAELMPYAGGTKGRVARPTPLWTPKGANSLLDPLPRGYPRHDLMACLAGQDKPYVGHGTRYRKREARTDQGVVNSPWRPQAITPKACFECPATGRTPYAGGGINALCGRHQREGCTPNPPLDTQGRQQPVGSSPARLSTTRLNGLPCRARQTIRRSWDALPEARGAHRPRGGQLPLETPGNNTKSLF